MTESGTFFMHEKTRGLEQQNMLTETHAGVGLKEYADFNLKSTFDLK